MCVSPAGCVQKEPAGIHIFSAWCRNNDFLCATLEVSRGFLLAGEETGAFHRDIDAAPRQFRRITQSRDADAIAIDAKRVALNLDIACKAAMHTVVFQQMRECLWRRQIVDRNDLHIRDLVFNHRGGRARPAIGAAPEGFRFLCSR